MHNAMQVLPEALYFGTEIQFWQIYTACVGNLLYRVSYKMIPCAVLLESFENFKTDTQAADIGRAFRLSTNIRRTNVSLLVR